MTVPDSSHQVYMLDPDSSPSPFPRIPMQTSSGRIRRILVATDSLKGTCTAIDAAAAIHAELVPDASAATAGSEWKQDGNCRYFSSTKARNPSLLQRSQSLLPLFFFARTCLNDSRKTGKVGPYKCED